MTVVGALPLPTKEQFAEPQPQSAEERKKLLKRADAMTVLIEKVSARLLGYALARLETQQFMAAGQPRDDHGKWTKGGSWASSLSEAEIAAFKDYKNYAHAGINSALRNGTELSSEQLAAVKEMDAAFERLPPTEEAQTVYRGMQIPSDHIINTASDFGRKPEGLVGAVITDNGFVSTSTSQEYANGWRSSNVFVTIDVPPGSKAASLARFELDGKLSESEVLLPRGTKFKVIDIKDITQEHDVVNKTTIHLEVIP